MILQETMRQRQVNRWNLPGWKFEPRYSSSTLIGDWWEKRHAYCKGDISYITSNMADYKRYHDSKSLDWSNMWNNRIKQQSGFGLKYILDHDSKDYLIRRLSTYNLEFSSPFRMKSMKYQPRRWDGKKQRWVPEKMDLPISQNKTLYDTIEKVKTNLRNLTSQEQKKTDKTFAILPTSQSQSSKLLYRHLDKKEL